MKHLFLFLILTVSHCLLGQNLNSKSSKVTFQITKLKVITVKGSISGMRGEVNLQNGKIDVCIDPATISTGIEKRDNHLKGSDFFDVEKYPEICFTSADLEKTDDGYLAKGKLTLHGVTKNVQIPLTVNEEKNQTVIKGEFEVNRFDYNLGADDYVGTFQIGETAAVQIICVLK